MSLIVGVGVGPGFQGSRNAFNPASLFTTEQGVIYDLPNPATAFQERTGASATTPSGADGPIGSLKDLSPNNNWATAPSDAARPLWRAAGYAESDGIDDVLNTASFTLDVPVTCISSFRLLTAGGMSVGLAGYVGYAYATGTAPANIHMYSGTDLVIGTTAINVSAVLTECYNGASSRGAVNNGSYVNGNTGAGTSMGGLKQFSEFGVSFAAMFLYRRILIGRLLTDPEIALGRTWCGAAAGLVL